MRNLIIILLFITALACSHNKVPEGVLSEKEITPVLVEIHLSEAIFTKRYGIEASNENFQNDLYLSILKKYNLDRKVFEASVLYYGKHPDLYKPVYDNILDRLKEIELNAKLKDSIQTKLLEKEIRSKDSLLTK